MKSGTRPARDTVIRDDSVDRDPLIRDPLIRDPLVREPLVREPLAREPLLREPLTREPLLREPLTREPLVREPLTREPLVREPLVREPMTHESVVHEPLVREPLVREPLAHEPVARDSAAETSEGIKGAGRFSRERLRFPGFGRIFRSKASATPAEVGHDSLLVFPSELAASADTSDSPSIEPATWVLTPRARTLAIVGGLVVLAGLGLFALRRNPTPSSQTAELRFGNLTINTRPDASEVLIDGAPRGTTPLSLSLPPGAHTITIRRGHDERVVPLTIASGAEVSQYFDMKDDEPAVMVGRVSVTTDPPGARVVVDGTSRGSSPLTVADLAPGAHKVAVNSDAGSAERTVTVAAGGTASASFSLSTRPAGPVGGWLSVSSPFDVEVVEQSDLIGTSGTNRIMLAAGRHDLTLINRSLGYQDARRVDVAPGKTMTIRIEPPTVSVSVNARPWAEVTVDGASVGQTPLANLSLSVGSHEAVFRHPQLGERKQTILVTAKGPNRVTADLTK